MATLDSEDAVMKMLRVESLDGLSEEQMYVLGLAQSDMSDELRAKLIATVPGFLKFLLGSLSDLEKLSEKNVDARTSESKHVHKAYADARSILKGELARDDLSEARRQSLVADALATADKQAAFASKNSAANERALQTLDSAATRYAVIGACTVLALAGIRGVIGRIR